MLHGPGRLGRSFVLLFVLPLAAQCEDRPELSLVDLRPFVTSEPHAGREPSRCLLADGGRRPPQIAEAKAMGRTVSARIAGEGPSWLRGDCRSHVAGGTGWEDPAPARPTPREPPEGVPDEEAWPDLPPNWQIMIGRLD